mgnify:CR=1 FL=1
MKAKLTPHQCTAIGLSLFLVVFIGVLIVFNAQIDRVPLRPSGSTQFAKATVVKVISSNIGEDENGEMQGNQVVQLKITSGPYKGQVCEAQSPHANHAGAYCVPGMKVIALVNLSAGGSLVASVYNYDRGLVLWVLIGLFFLILCAIGGRKGVTSSAALIFTFVCIMFLYIPMMYIGISPFFAASLTAVLVTFVSMLLIGGWSIKSLCSILGTAAGILTAGLTAQIFGYFGHISGLNVEEIETLAYISQNSRLDVSGILYSGILISSLGAVIDVSMSVASTIEEIHATNPSFTAKQLFQSGIRVGKDMMGTMSTTLILAYAGSSINTLIILYSYSMSYLQFMNGYEIGIEILSGISGSIGVILAVPFVSAISSLWMTRSEINRPDIQRRR